jgi:hypothetical protein
VYNRVVSILQQNMQPELRFVNELLANERDEDALAMINEKAASFGTPLLEVVDAVSQVLAQRGDKETVEKLAFLRTAIERALNVPAK